EQAFRTGLRELGYVVGKDIAIVTRYANGDAARFPELLRELTNIPVDILLVSPSAVKAATESTTTVPIICATLSNAVENGLVQSLSHPGGNVTGLSGQDQESDPKRLQLTKELLPTLKRLSLLYDATRPEAVRSSSELLDLGRRVGVTVH